MPGARGARDAGGELTAPGLDPILRSIAAGDVHPVYLFAGDLVLAERAGQQVAKALAGATGAEPDVRRRPRRLAPILDDLRTFSLFTRGKVVVAVDTAVVADRKAAAMLVSEAVDSLPLSGAEGLTEAEREAGSRLLQALHLFGVDPRTAAADPLEALPDWAFTGGRGGKTAAKRAASRRTALSPLLARSLEEGLEGMGDEDVTLLSDAVRRGLPEGQILVLVERSVASDHPLVGALDEIGAFVEVGRVEAGRGGWSGAGDLVRAVAEDVGVEVRRDAAEELVRRTLRQEGRRRGQSEASADSTARLAGEIRKLAELSGGDAIDRDLVERAVVDRGEEDVWGILDAVGEGRGSDALESLERYLAGAEDPVSARLSFFGLFAGFCRQLTAVRGAVDLLGVPPGERSYPRFRDRLAPALTGELPGGEKNPLAGLHPYRLHRSYLAASRMEGSDLRRLPDRVLRCELALKGESGEPAAALAALVAEVAEAAAS